MNNELTYKCITGQIDIIEEHFHPSGSVRYTIMHDVEFGANPGELFEITGKEEFRQV